LKKSKHKNVTGIRIRVARLNKNPPLSQVDLARCATRQGASLDQAAISRIEHQTITVTDYELIAIARCLGVSVDSLCSGKS
jgi:hypothetical protein